MTAGVRDVLEGTDREGKSGRHADAVLGVAGVDDGVMGWSVHFRVSGSTTDSSPSFGP